MSRSELTRTPLPASSHSNNERLTQSVASATEILRSIRSALSAMERLGNLNARDPNFCQHYRLKQEHCLSLLARLRMSNPPVQLHDEIQIIVKLVRETTCDEVISSPLCAHEDVESLDACLCEIDTLLFDMRS